MADQSLIDCHVHLAAFPDGDNGCYISPRMLKRARFRFLLWKHGFSPQAPADANRKYVDDLLVELRASRRVRQAVLLGMDGSYDRNGSLDLAQTDFLVGNDYVLATSRAHPNEFLAGVSINPQRKDAIDELHRCADAGAVLVKILPNAQLFDPADSRYKPFYRALAARGLPLLSHVGYEFSLIGKDQSLGDPDRLRTPLDEGVTVIAAHACSYGLMIYEKFLPTFRRMVRVYPRFFGDVSALTLPNRLKMLLALRDEPDLQSRLLFGTDYPLPVTHLPIWGRVDGRSMQAILRTTNRFDRQHLVCRALGIGLRSIETILPSSPHP